MIVIHDGLPIEVRKIIQVGDSLAITIPSGVALSMNLEKGDYVEVYWERDKLTIQKINIGVI